MPSSLQGRRSQGDGKLDTSRFRHIFLWCGRIYHTSDRPGERRFRLFHHPAKGVLCSPSGCDKVDEPLRWGHSDVRNAPLSTIVL
jgi:hypothetical protein